MNAITLGGTLYTQAQPNITSIGTLSQLEVSGDATFSTAYAITLGGTLSTPAQPNITSVGTLSQLEVSSINSSVINNSTDSTDVVPLLVSAQNLSNGGKTTIRIGKNDSATYNQGLISHFFSSSGSSNNRIDFGFVNDSSVKMCIKGDGKVGIGTTTPSASLEVVGGAMYIAGAESRFWNSTYTDPESGVLRAVKISGNGLAVNGGTRLDGLTVSGGSTTTINNTTNATEVIVSNMTAGSIGTGRTITTRIGRDATTNFNASLISHFYNASGSNQNRLDFGFNGAASRMSLRGDGRLGIGTTSPSQLLDVSGGNIRCSGSIIPEAWVAGQVIQVLHFGPDNSTPSQYAFNTTTYTTWVSVSFTPKSTSSKIIINADGYYEINGGGVDNFYVRVTDNGNQQFEKRQTWGSGVGTGTRSTVLLPLHCGYSNTTTTTRTIAIQFREGSGDDTLTMSLGSDQNWSLTITEIAV